jgi:AP-1 complex subunit gamma-1
MKLIASPHFPEKRIGYLGMMLLLSEEADVLMLATNGLKNDLNSDNKFVAGLSLCAIGNLATADMSRDLAPEVDKHLKSTQPYLRKKACLAMARCLTKCPEMVEDFVDRVVTLLKDRNHGVLITVVQLMTQVLIMDQKNMELEGYGDDEISPCQDAFLRLVPSLVKLLRNIISGGYSESGGGSDPFLQVGILTLLRLLGVGNAKASEEMNDVLAQVATNTETSKNAGNAILYECVQTIMAIESEDTLRVLAVNILGRFLLNRDNNIRYVALNTLSKCIMEENQTVKEDLIKAEGEENSAASALQRHRTTIVDCLKDPDISIRQRALELIYHLVNKDNVEDLTGELLNYLVLCPREHREDICTRVLRVVDKFSPNDRWRVDTLITMLTIAGRECTRNIQSACIIYISRSSEDLRAYATHKLLKAIRDDDGSQRGLLVVAIWCIGEYGDLLLKPYTYTPSQSNEAGIGGIENVVSISFMAIEPNSIVTTVDEVTGRLNCGQEVKERALTCYTKLCDRLADTGDTETLETLHNHVKKYSTHHSLELQLRSCEFDALISAMKGKAPSSNGALNGDIFGSEGVGSVNNNMISAAKEALARMPVVDISVMHKKRSSGYATVGIEDYDGTQGQGTTSEPGTGGDLLDLNDIFGGGGTPQQSEVVAPAANGVSIQAPTQASNGEKSDIDLLSDIFSAPPAPAATPIPLQGNGISEGMYDPFNATPAANGAVVPTVNPIDAFAPVPSPAAEQPLNDMFSTPAPAENLSISVHGVTYEGLAINFECSKSDPMSKEKSALVAVFKNLTGAPIYDLSLQCAVPKYVKMELLPPTSTTIPVTVGDTGSITQTINVNNSMVGKKNLMLKLKIGFTSNGTQFNHMATCSGFPSGEF